MCVYIMGYYNVLVDTSLQLSLSSWCWFDDMPCGAKTVLIKCSIGSKIKGSNTLMCVCVSSINSCPVQ